MVGFAAVSGIALQEDTYTDLQIAIDFRISIQQL